MKTEKREVYVSEDGLIFETLDECKKHEQSVKEREDKTSYWRVTYKPDLTEGRGWYGSIYIECYGPKHSPRMWVEDWCYREIGRPIAFAQGCSAMDNWRLQKVSRDEFLNPRGQKVGDYGYEPQYKRLVAGSGEKGLVEDEGAKSNG